MEFHPLFLLRFIKLEIRQASEATSLLQCYSLSISFNKYYNSSFVVDNENHSHYNDNH